MKKVKQPKKKIQPPRKKVSPKKASNSADWKAFSQYILQDYALPLKRIIEQKIASLQRRWAQI